MAERTSYATVSWLGPPRVGLIETARDAPAGVGRVQQQPALAGAGYDAVLGRQRERRYGRPGALPPHDHLRMNSSKF